MTAYYNENDPYAAQWLRNLIAAGHIAPGVVDSRSIVDVVPSDLEGFTQCHFFAGIGIWSHALRAAGWPDDRPVWTGSCPCQPFSTAGQNRGFDDERHLWPHWHWLIGYHRPAILFGEQVANKSADPWIDLVQDDMEALDYAFGAVPFPAASVGAPHIRDRLYWMAYAERKRVRCDGPGADAGTARGMQGTDWKRERLRPDAGASDGVVGGVAYADIQRRAGIGRSGQAGIAEHRETGGMADAGIAGLEIERQQPARGELASIERSRAPGRLEHVARDGREQWRAESSWWSTVSGRGANFIECTDGKARPVEPGTFPLANGVTGRVGKLRAYGNAIVAPQAAEFIGAFLAYDRGDDLY